MTIEIMKCEGYWLAVRGDENGTGVSPIEALSNLEFLHGVSE
jgi:hypothetical protein